MLILALNVIVLVRILAETGAIVTVYYCHNIIISASQPAPILVNALVAICQIPIQIAIAIA